MTKIIFADPFWRGYSVNFLIETVPSNGVPSSILCQAFDGNYSLLLNWKVVLSKLL